MVFQVLGLEDEKALEGKRVKQATQQ